MATRKKKTEWPKVIVGSHSTRTEYEDGRVEFVNDWEALKRDVQEAIAAYEASLTSEVTEEKPKKAKKPRKSKTKTDA